MLCTLLWWVCVIGLCASHGLGACDATQPPALDIFLSRSADIYSTTGPPLFSRTEFDKTSLSQSAILREDIPECKYDQLQDGLVGLLSASNLRSATVGRRRVEGLYVLDFTMTASAVMIFDANAGTNSSVFPALLAASTDGSEVYRLWPSSYNSSGPSPNPFADALSGSGPTDEDLSISTGYTRDEFDASGTEEPVQVAGPEARAELQRALSAMFRQPEDTTRSVDLNGRSGERYLMRTGELLGTASFPGVIDIPEEQEGSLRQIWDNGLLANNEIIKLENTIRDRAASEAVPSVPPTATNAEITMAFVAILLALAVGELAGLFVTRDFWPAKMNWVRRLFLVGVTLLMVAALLPLIFLLSGEADAKRYRGRLLGSAIVVTKVGGNLSTPPSYFGIGAAVVYGVVLVANARVVLVAVLTCVGALIMVAEVGLQSWRLARVWTDAGRKADGEEEQIIEDKGAPSNSFSDADLRFSI